MAVIEYAEVEISLGRTLTIPERLQAQQWIGFAEVVLTARLGNLTTLNQDALRYVMTEAVALRMKRPDGAVQVSVSVDDASTSRTYERSTGQITILDEWWALLSPDNDSAAGFSTRPVFEPDAPPLDSWA